MVVGSMDHDKDQNPFNSAFGIDSHGQLLAEVYHKRYLVPFGEYTPVFVNSMPEWMQRLTNTPAGGGFHSGTDPAAFNLTCGKVAPLVCFETLSPELVASSVRKGGQLLVNISDLAWFHKSCVGEQMLAFSVLRAVENSRWFVFAANTGPSAIIDAKGKIVHLSKQNTEQLLVGKVTLSSEITPFTHWFMF
jgi:apolipoprotein N-acyltransferase